MNPHTSRPRPGHSRRLRRTVAAVVLAPLLLLPLAAGCSGSSSGSGEVSDSGARSVEGPGDVAASPSAGSAPAPAADTPAAGASQADVATRDRAVVSTGSVSLTSKDVGKVRTEVAALLQRYDGFLADENTSTDTKGRPSSSTLTLRVPAKRFDAAMNALAGLGTLRDASRSAQDVTTDVIDVDQRIRAQEVGLRRLEQLMQRSSSLGNLLLVENQVTTRQAALDSLKTRQTYLRDQTSLATITLSVARPDAKYVPKHRDAGFLGGLEDGWNALVSVVSGLLRGAGAALPFAVVLLVLWIPGRLLVRRFRRTRAQPAV